MLDSVAGAVRKASSEIYNYFSARDLIKHEEYILHLKGEFQPDNPQLGIIGYETKKYSQKISFLLGKLPNVLDLMWLALAKNFDLDLNATMIGFLPIEASRALVRSFIKTRQASQGSDLVTRMSSILIPKENLVEKVSEFGYGEEGWKK
jgi:hypothetical protein